jgi:prepilin-type processing-associated H-X9-DG protein
MTRPHCCGFTLAELLVVLGVVIVLVSIFVPFIRARNEVAYRDVCASNLRQLHQAFRDYFATNDYLYPRTKADPTSGSWTAFTGPDDANPFADNSTVAANDVTASLFLLVRNKHITDLNRFICPSSGDVADRISNPSLRSNFRSGRNLSYGYASPFSLVPEYRLNDTMPARCAILADKAPAGLEATLSTASSKSDPFQIRKLNSMNHRGAGQNVLFADGSVRFETSPFCGVQKDSGVANWGDNIFSALAAKPLTQEVPHDQAGIYSTQSSPSYQYDSLLVPAADFAK